LNKIYYSYTEFKNDSKELVKLCQDFNADTFLAVARGGLTLAHFMAQALNIRELYTINAISYDRKKQNLSSNIFNIPNLDSSKKVLIIDDIVDSGRTMKEILELLKELYPNIEFKLATLFYKKDAQIKPDFFVKQNSIWIEFFWEVDWEV